MGEYPYEPSAPPAEEVIGSPTEEANHLNSYLVNAFEMDISEEIENWDEMHQSKTPTAILPIKDTTFIVNIKGIEFKCAKLVLQCCSGYFARLPVETDSVVLPHDIVTPQGFSHIRDWMVGDNPSLHLLDFIDVFIGAKYLDVKDLVHHCWAVLDKLPNDEQWILYNDCLRFGSRSEQIRNCIIPHFGQIFLRFIGGINFMKMPLQYLCEILSHNFICVHEEGEIFLAAVLWLDHNWEERQKVLMDVMSCIRFRLMSAAFLLTISENPGCEEVARLMCVPEVLGLVEDALAYNAMLSTKSQFSKQTFVQLLKGLNIVTPKPRCVIEDPDIKTEATGLPAPRTPLEFSRFKERLQQNKPLASLLKTLNTKAY